MRRPSSSRAACDADCDVTARLLPVVTAVDQWRLSSRIRRNSLTNHRLPSASRVSPVNLRVAGSSPAGARSGFRSGFSSSADGATPLILALFSEAARRASIEVDSSWISRTTNAQSAFWGYEPGGRMFESCWAHHSTGRFFILKGL